MLFVLVVGVAGALFSIKMDLEATRRVLASIDETRVVSIADRVINGKLIERLDDIRLVGGLQVDQANAWMIY